MFGAVSLNLKKGHEPLWDTVVWTFTLVSPDQSIAGNPVW